MNKRISEKEYFEKLEILPPHYFDSCTFSLGEEHHNGYRATYTKFMSIYLFLGYMPHYEVVAVANFLKTLRYLKGFTVAIPEGSGSLYAIIETPEKNLVNIEMSGIEKKHVRFVSMHKPNRKSGTGFDLGEVFIDDVNANVVSSFAKIQYPNWASDEDCASVVKYKDIDEYLKTHDYYIVRKIS